MNRWVNGVEVELSDDAEIIRLGDRLLVRTPEGLRSAVAVRSGGKVLVSYNGQTYVVEKAAAHALGGAAQGSGSLVAPMPGQVVDVLVSDGETVTEGQKLAVVEAMKTHQPLFAPFDGVVAGVAVKKGDQVSEGQALLQVVAA